MNKQELPSVACGNKNDIDSNQHKLSQLDKMKLKEKRGMYYDISAKSNHNFEKPFLYLARKLTDHKDLVFVPQAPRVAPVVSFM